MACYKLDKNNTICSPELFQLSINKDLELPLPFFSYSLFEAVNTIKKKIGLFKDWDNIKKYTNTYEYIHTIVPNAKHSVSKVKPISRAFFKLVEICNNLNLLDKYKFSSMKGFFLAEGPGGFIEAMTYMRDNNSDNYYGMTLINDSDENIPGWRKIDNLLSNNSNIFIETGADKTGNMLSPDNFEHCYSNYKNSMDIVTADGGFDFSIDFNQQEQMASKLILTEILYAIIMQKKGGSCIIKMYDTFTKLSVDIIYFLSSFYNTTYITKPCTSRVANSERYIVCKDFKLDDSSAYYLKFKEAISYLHENEDIGIASIINVEFPYKFITSLDEIIAIIATQQIENIQTTLKLINNNDKMYDKQNKFKESNIQKCITWCNKHKIPYNKFLNTTNQFRNISSKNAFI
jgi:23S rRNA U2552 (ribose-2'-O)-methylase RlmE/FtsJ